jgi:hypothetical protein
MVVGISVSVDTNLRANQYTIILTIKHPYKDPDLPK